ncbi:MAG: DUF3667 domain-containing protein [Ginsengibacter sp.]
MSHLHLRKDNHCLNCSTEVVGRYCHVCGQENVEVKESVWHFILHFFNDITHFDGTFFSTLKDLIFKPGFLSREYMNGRRARYLNPVRMYLFTSFLFFLIFFSFIGNKQLKIQTDESVFNGKTKEEIKRMSPKEFDQFTSKINQRNPMTSEEFGRYMDSSAEGIYFTDKKFRDQEQYDSLIKSGVVKDNWIQKKLVRKEIEFNRKFHKDMVSAFKEFFNNLIHNFPQMLFVSLPFVALLFKLLYIRHKEYYYVSHGIFVLHLYIFIFIAMLLSFGISELGSITNWGWLKYFNILLIFYIFFYLYRAMYNFYKQKTGKTLLKYFLFLFNFLFLMTFIFIAFLFVSFFQI